MANIPIVKIQSGDTESGFVIINADEFDEKKHRLFVEKPQPKSAEADEQPTRAALLKTRKAELIAMAEAKGEVIVPDEVTVEQLVDLIVGK